MFEMRNFFNADWDGLFRFFASGNPPLALQLLALNTIFFVLFIFRNATSKHRMRNSTAYFVQGLLIATNVVVVFSKDAMHLVDRLT